MSKKDNRHTLSALPDGKRLCRKFGVFENGLDVCKEGGLLIPDFTLYEEASGRPGHFAVLVCQGAWIDQAKGQLMNFLARKAGGKGFLQQLEDALSRGRRHGGAPK